MNIISSFIYFTGFFLVSVCFSLFAQEPIVTSFSPRVSTVDSEITILGSGFSNNINDLIVHFGSVNAVIEQASEEVLIVNAPPGATYNSISVTNLNSGLTGYSPYPYTQSFSGGEFDISAVSVPYDFASENELYDISLNDFDQDGLVDIITANNNSNLITVYRNTSNMGTVSFSKSLITINSNTLNVNSCDLNGDGKPDVLISKSGNPGDRIYVLKNTSTTGNITFSNPEFLLVDGNIARRIEIQDLDNDGLPDLIVTNQGSSKITLLKNKSTANTISFEPLKIIQLIDPSVTDLHSSGLAVRDLNGDGYPDIAISQFLERNVYIFPNISEVGTLAFGNVQILEIPGNISNIIIGDINLDNKPDLVVSKLQQHQVSVLLNEGSGSEISFSDEAFFTVNDRPWGLELGDVNGDGKVDIIASSINFNDKKISILENQSTEGNLLMTVKYVATPEITRNLKLGDIDNDGKPDFVITCIESFNVTVLRNENCFVPSVVPTGPLSICTGSSTILKANTGRGVTYQWLKDNVEIKIGSEDTVHVSPPGIYNVIATSESGSCVQNSNAVTVNIGTGNAPELPVIYNDGPFCHGDNIVLSTDAISNGIYSWTGPNGFKSSEQNISIPEADALKAGDYTLQVSVDECSSFISETIVKVNTMPVFTVVTDDPLELCQGNTVSLSVRQLSGYSFQWNRDGTPISGATSNVYVVNEGGTYDVDVTLVAHSCVGSSENSVSIRVLDPIVAEFVITGEGCTGLEQQFTNQSTYTAGESINFEWDFGDGSGVVNTENAIYTYADSGEYTITLEVAYTSGACSDLTSQVKSIHSTPIFVIERSPADDVCENDTITLSTSVDFPSYLWSTREITREIKVTAPDDYYVTVSDDNNCQHTEDTTVTMLERPDVTANADQFEVPPGSSIQLEATGALTYLWTPADVLDDSTLANPIANVFVTTLFIVEGTNASFCTDTASVLITILEGPGINVKPRKLFSPNGDGIDDYWIIEGIENYPECTLLIFNGNGSKVYEATPYNNDWDAVYNGQYLIEGAYFFAIRCENKDSFSGSILVIR